MKPNMHYTKFMFAIFTLFISCMLVDCNSNTQVSSSNTDQSVPISLGTLSNGSIIYTSKNNIPINRKSSVAATLSLVGSSANSSIVINFGDSVVHTLHGIHSVPQKWTSSRLQSSLADSNGITITPNSCSFVTEKIGVPLSCSYIISVSKNTKRGIYDITPFAFITVNGISTYQTLSPIIILV